MPRRLSALPACVCGHLAGRGRGPTERTQCPPLGLPLGRCGCREEASACTLAAAAGFTGKRAGCAVLCMRGPQRQRRPPALPEPIYGADRVGAPSAPDLFLLLLVWFCFGARSLVTRAGLQLLVERIVEGVLGLVIHFPSVEIAGTPTRRAGL